MKEVFNGQFIFNPTRPGDIGGTTPANGNFLLVTANFDEIIQATSDTLTAAELRGQQISNYGQGAVDNLQALPTAAEGMHARIMCGTVQGANYFRFQAGATDKIYWNGIAGSDNGYITIAAPAVNAWFDISSFKTGASTYDWEATVGFGNWAAGGP